MLGARAREQLPKILKLNQQVQEAYKVQESHKATPKQPQNRTRIAKIASQGELRL